MATVIFKTAANTLPGVIQHVKHALQGEPQFVYRGDTILIAQTIDELPPREKQIRHSMVFVRARRDNQRETDAIWGHHWPWIIDGESLKELARPFNMSDVQVTDKNYGQGGTVVYVDPLDDQALMRGGYLQGILE
jgi:5-methylcytosine-specific restriction protein A